MASTQEGKNDMAAQSLLWVLNEFRRYDSEMPIYTAIIFLLAAENPGIRLRELERRANMSRSAISRNILALSSQHWTREPETGHRRPGHDLVVASTDPMDARGRLVTLTPAGKALFTKLTLALTRGP
jgi:DNA-binding MarR family transcriptional regulator